MSTAIRVAGRRPRPHPLSITQPDVEETTMTAALNPWRPFTGSERQLLENTLQLHRDELVATWFPH
jgi:hypothetical protein